MRMTKEKLRRVDKNKLAIFTVLTLIGCIVKVNSIELFFGIIIDFSSVFLLLILFILGEKKAIIGAIIISICGILFNGSIIHIVISLCEVLFIIYFLKKGKSNRVIIIDFFYWMLIIILSLIRIFSEGSHEGLLDCAYFPILMLSVTSMFNTLIAEVVYVYIIKVYLYGEKLKIEFKSIILHIIAGAILLPFIINIFIDVVNSLDYISNAALTSAEEVYDSVWDELEEYWDENNIYDLKSLDATEIEYLENIIKKACRHKQHNVHVKDKDGNVIIDFMKFDKHIIDYDNYHKNKISDSLYELSPKNKISLDYNGGWTDGYLVYESELGDIGLYLMVEVPIILYRDRIIHEYLGQLEFLVIFSIFILITGKLLLGIMIGALNKINSNTTNFLTLIESDEIIEWPSSSISEIDLLTNNIKNMINSLRFSFIEVKESQDKLYRQAYYDSLTKLPNRLSLRKYLNKVINECNDSICVMFMDINRFKSINDSMGHDIGDQLLILVAERLKELQDEKYSVFRLGGDEFVIVLKVSSEEEVISYGNRTLEIFKDKFTFDNNFSISVSGSIGASVYPKDGTDMNKIIKYADTAMYASKYNGGNSLYLFNDKLKKEFYEKAIIEKDINNAIENNELYLEYQPQVSSKDGKIKGFEALLRWKNNELGILTPDKFITIIEDSEVILEIDKWVVREVCRVIRLLRDEGYGDIPISMNLSAKHFVNDDIVNIVLDYLNENDLKPNLLTFEITEVSLIKNISTVKQVLERFKEKGINISMDDLGKSYSSLNILTSFPIDEVKIDMGSLKNILYDDKKKKVLNLILKLAHDLNLNIVAEGIETEEEKLFLENIRCDYFQGYYFSKPIDLDKVKELLIQVK